MLAGWSPELQKVERLILVSQAERYPVSEFETEESDLNRLQDDLDELEDDFAESFFSNSNPKDEDSNQPELQTESPDDTTESFANNGLLKPRCFLGKFEIEEQPRHRMEFIGHFVRAKA